MAKVMDVNADVGEERGDDAALLALVSSANVATGAHAGGGPVLEETVLLAARAGCAVGAHPSYRDRANFGRLSLADEIPMSDLVADLVDQVLLVAAACRRHETVLTHVKAHGALYNDAGAHESIGTALVGAIHLVHERSAGPVPILVGPSGGSLEGTARASGVPYRREAFADRAYTSTGALAHRSHPGSVLVDSVVIGERVEALALGRSIIAIDGSSILVPADTICLHGDTPGAVAHARQVRDTLERLGFVVSADWKVT